MCGIHSSSWDCPCRQSPTVKISSQILHFWKRPWVNIYWFFCQYLTPGVIWGLYVRLRDTPDATRPFLVDITSSRVVFSANLVPRVPWDNSEMCVLARSLVMRLLSQTGFWRQIPLVTLANGLIWRLRRRSSPRVPELVKNWSLWTEKCPRPWWRHFLLCDLGFYGCVLKPIHGYVRKVLGMSVKWSVSWSVSRDASQTHLFRPSVHVFTPGIFLSSHPGGATWPIV